MFRFLIVSLTTLVLVATQFMPANAGELRVFAAASLKNALDAVAGDWQEKTGNQLLLTVAGSSAIARQVEQGAPADNFISADMKWMDYLEKAGEIRSDTRINLVGNQLVLIGSVGDERRFDIKQGFDLVSELDGGRLAVGATESVPAGRYAKAALEATGIWDGVKAHLAEAENVRAALALVSRGEAPLGIVYATDAKVDGGVKVLGTFPQSSHPPIIYPAAVVASSSNPLAQEFMSYLQSNAAKRRFEEAGFSTNLPSMQN